MFIYEENSTMKLVGEQSSEIGNVGRKAIFDVLNAYSKHPEYGVVQMATDLYLLGYAYGKDDEYAD